MLFEYLSEKDIKTFRSYVASYAPAESVYTYNSIGPHTELILRHWDEAKYEYLYEALGNQFIVEREVEFKQPNSVIRTTMGEELDCGGLREFRQQVREYVNTHFGAYSDEYYSIMSLFDRQSLVENKTGYGYTKLITFPNGKSVKIVPDAKVMKTLGKIAKHCGLEDSFERFRLKHSLILNQKKLTGTLCISIHPMDYITMSDNANGWSSCMSWRNDGDYRMGTVEMMNSPCVVVAYLKSTDKTLSWGGSDCDTWNSKLWRTLFIVHEKAILSIKSYPYENVDLTKCTIDWLQEMVEHNLGWKFSETCHRIEEDTYFTHNSNKVIIRCQTGKMYNDFGCADHYGVLADDLNGRIDIEYSGTDECMFCGSTEHLYEDTNCVLCRNCADLRDSEYTECEHCGARWHEDDIYWVDDVPLCPDCYQRAAGLCEITDEYAFNEDLITIYLASSPDKIDYEHDYHLRARQDFVEDACHYEEPYWLETYVTRPPHYDKENNSFYWNIEDFTSTGLWRYYGVKNIDSYRQA